MNHIKCDSLTHSAHTPIGSGKNVILASKTLYSYEPLLTGFEGEPEWERGSGNDFYVEGNVLEPDILESCPLVSTPCKGPEDSGDETYKNKYLLKVNDPHNKDSCKSQKSVYKGSLGAHDVTYANRLVKSLVSPDGSIVKVFENCINNTCVCKYYIGEMLCQLKPCRVAAILVSGESWVESYWDLLWYVTEGFPIVEGDVPSYVCENYSSILDPVSKAKMDEIIKRELDEGMISESSSPPHCIHSLGAVPKPDGGIRPITDCSRPLFKSVNNYCGSLFKEFCYKGIDDVVQLLTWGNFMSVVDIKSAYRAVPILGT